MASDQDDVSTERARERVAEEAQYVPVIVKRTDEALRHPDDILSTAILEGLEQLERPTASLALSSVTGGLVVGFSAMAVGVVLAALGPHEDVALRRLTTALVYPLGFVVCMMSGSQLFTEHTATAVYPVLDRQAGALALLRLWGVVSIGNLVGAAAMALLLQWADPVVDARAGYRELATTLVHTPPRVLLVSAVLAGWLMALGAWLVLATPPRVSQVVLIFVVTFLIGLGGLHHSIVGAVELFAALLGGAAIRLEAAARALGIALLGNLLGGSLLVAVLNYGHIRKSQAGRDDAQRGERSRRGRHAPRRARRVQGRRASGPAPDPGD